MSTALEWWLAFATILAGILAGLLRYTKTVRIPGKALDLNVSLSLGKAGRNKGHPSGSGPCEDKLDGNSQEFKGKFWRENFKLRKKQLRKYAEACSFSPP